MDRAFLLVEALSDMMILNLKLLAHNIWNDSKVLSSELTY